MLTKKGCDDLNTFIYILLTIGYLLLFFWGIQLIRKQKKVDFSVVILFVLFGLFYDNLVIGTGRFIGEGQFLASLSALRFWLHAFLTPLLVIFVWQICQNLKFNWTNSETAKVMLFLITIGLILYEWYQSIRKLELQANWERDVLVYESVVQQSNPLMVIIATIIVGLVGILLWKKYKFYWLAIGTIVMIIGSGLTFWIKNDSIMNLFEFLFMVSLLMTKKFQVKKTTHNKKK